MVVSNSVNRMGKSTDCKLIDDCHPITHEVAALVLIWKYFPLWNTVLRKALYLQLFVTFEYLLKAKPPTLSVNLIRH